QLKDAPANLTPLPFILKAVAHALQQYPLFKSSLKPGGDQLVMKSYCHIGMAVDTPAGLMVPVIRDVDKKSVWQLAIETAEIGEQARNKKLRPDQMQGGCFTVSSLGNLGGQGFTPIINAPEVAILGVSAMQVKPVFDGEKFAPRKMLPIALSYDHRVINGADGGRFSALICASLKDLRLLLM
ncbi:MAG: 2-oxo acid dehydrogenase subunit E2, partial [Pseudomonadales bacterium]|nr:2-oxo acid dehydrogenase subunit E2 [Pseudomonadales bacterium]